MKLIFLPGLDGTGLHSRAACAALQARGIDAIAVSYPPDRPLGYEALEAFARERLPAEPFVLLGESFSGPVAIRIAADPPPELRGLVLSTTFAHRPVPMSGTLAPFARLAPALPPMALLAWALLGPWATPALKAQLREATTQVPPEVLRARTQAAMRADVTAALSAIAVPTLQLVARGDRVLVPSATARLQAGLRRGRRVDIDGPHMLWQAAPEACADAVVAFVAALRLPAGPTLPE